MKASFAGKTKVLGAVLLTFLLCPWTEGGELSFGTCPAVNIVTPLATNPLVPAAGGTQTWFEVARFPSLIENSLRCVTYAFTATTNVATTMNVAISGNKVITGNAISTTGTLTNMNTGLPLNFATWRATFSRPLAGLPLLPTRLPSSYSIVALDPAAVPTWVVLYNCQQFGIMFLQNSWILSTIRPISTANLAAAKAAAQNAGVPSSKYITSAC